MISTIWERYPKACSYLDEAFVNGPPVDHGPLHTAIASLLVEVFVDGIQTTASSGAAVLRILGERYGTFNAIAGGVCVCV